jgi:hypothetical protein
MFIDNNPIQLNDVVLLKNHNLHPAIVTGFKKDSDEFRVTISNNRHGMDLPSVLWLTSEDVLIYPDWFENKKALN